MLLEHGRGFGKWRGKRRQLGCHGLRIRVHRGKEQRVRVGRKRIWKWRVGMALLENRERRMMSGIRAAEVSVLSPAGEMSGGTVLDC